ncbi:MAG: hypothetical protein WAQ99_10865 [Pyrinomonadaceae bacterium]
MKIKIIENKPPPNFQATAPAKHPLSGPSIRYAAFALVQLRSMSFEKQFLTV